MHNRNNQFTHCGEKGRFGGFTRAGMTRGNQREIDRMRAQNRSKKKAAKESKGGDPVARRER